MSLKVVEYYIQTLKEYTAKLKKDKITLLMQVGEFFEIYGLVYPDGTRVGNLWEFCDNVNLKVALKPQVVYNNSAIQVYMGGVGESYINPYIQKAVDRFGWTIVIFEQSRIGNSNKFERNEASIISPGININSDNFSNITMIIYMEQVRKYYSTPKHTTQYQKTGDRDKYTDNNQINIGVAFVDCLTGENGIMAINNSPASDISIPLDELLKILTIKNPNELYIYLENFDYNPADTSSQTTQTAQTTLTDDDLINALHLFNYNFKIIRDPSSNPTLDIIHKLQYQTSIFDQVYIRHRGIMDIMQQLGIDGAEHTYSRIALTLIIDFINKHDKTIIEKLSAPEIIVNSDKYLMLANNSLEQLDIIDNYKTEYKKNINCKRLSLLELLDNTKTPLGKILLRQRLSIPITDETILKTRYNQIAEMLELHINHIKQYSTDKFGSPLHQLRQKLENIRNIENYLRKVITLKIQPQEVSPYIESLSNCSRVYEYIQEFTNTKSNNQQIKHIHHLLPNEKQVENFTRCQNKFKTDLLLETMNCSVWNGIESNPFRKGINKPLDNLQEEIDNDRGFLDSLLLELSKVIDPKYEAIHSTTQPHSPNIIKSLIFIGENANKGIHIFTNTSRKDILEAYFAKPHAQLRVGNYRISSKDIKFLKMKESKWEIEIPLLKTSNGTLKVNIDRIGKLAKQEFLEWLRENIINQTDILDALNSFAIFIANIDVLQANVLNAIEKGYTKPEIDSSAIHSFMKAEKLRHPIIEHINTATKYVPNDVIMGTQGVDGKEVDGILLFGVNAVGKSSLMKSLGINVIMAQAGMYVASSRFQYKPYKYLFTRIRNNDNLYAGLSSFEVEMKEFKVILKYANEDSIILGDELAAGTNTEDATAIVASGVIELSKRKSNFLFATHLHFLADMNCIKELGNVRLCHLLVERDLENPKKLIYNRKLSEGNGPKSYGILVCDAMNMDIEFLNRAKSIRESIEISKTNTNVSIGEVGSKYNKNKVISLCEICLEESSSDVHHINQQCDANNCDLIDDLELGLFNKNKLWNLVSLCKKCHQSVHSSPPRININGYINTSNGIELCYELLDNKPVVKQKIIANIINNSLNSLLDGSLNNAVVGGNNSNKDIKMSLVNVANTIPKKNIKNLKQSVGIDFSDDINKIILDMKSNNVTPKKIQFDLKRYHNIEITQQQIREIKN